MPNFTEVNEDKFLKHFNFEGRLSNYQKSVSRKQMNK